MLEVVTKYTDNLEELVAERTHQLQEEQKKTEELLCRMLPKYSLVITRELREVGGGGGGLEGQTRQRKGNRE